MAARALSLHVTGIVQGVGFRPFVYNLARRLDLVGWVRNSSEGVFCLVEGPPEAIEAFERALREEAPPMAVIDSVIAEEVEPEGLTSFEIVESARTEGAMTLVSPDIATCAACASELADPADRRYRYPFVNCTNCGPRFTIIEDIPYDRPATTMRDFRMCDECAAEYSDPGDRRFHAQPDACLVCGPRLYLNLAGEGTSSELSLPADAKWTPEVETAVRSQHERDSERARSDSIMRAVVTLLRSGRIVAIKGLGGFQLACDADNEAAVARLRERKHRWGKPLAIMTATIEDARRYCEVSEAETRLLSSPARPIVLLRQRDGAPPLAPSLAPGLHELGVMLPYTPLHHLLLSDFGSPLVMTSGNLSEEPIAMRNAEALERLAPIADAFLLHDRDIHSRYDDSVSRMVGGRIEIIRRARGYAPYPLTLPFSSDIDILAAGPEQKNTFCLLTKEHAFVSQHIGDMENAKTLEHYEATLELYERLFRISPQLVAYDLHPEYLSTKFAKTLDLPKVGVQHHHAHVASVTAEHGHSHPVIGIALDGTGYGTDGHIWGGEILIADWAGFSRFAHLAEVPMPGGAAAVRRPARMAIGTLVGLDAGLLDHPGAAPLRSRLADGEEALLLEMIERRVNCPPTSSMGRLFDTVSALCGVRDDALYEGQAAVELEAIAAQGVSDGYRFALSDSEPVVADPLPVIEGVLDDIAEGTEPALVSARFHAAVADLIAEAAVLAAGRTGIRSVALAGGVLMNRLVVTSSLPKLADADLQALLHERLPTNDGAVSFGQAVVAWARRHGI